MCVRKKEMDEMKKSLDAIHAGIAQMMAEKRKERKSEIRNYQLYNLTRVISLPIWMCAKPPRRSLTYCGRARPKLKRRFPLGFKLRYLATGEVHEAHASRILFYATRTLWCLKRYWRMSRTMIKDTWSRNRNSAASTKTQKLNEILVKWHGLSEV